MQSSEVKMSQTSRTRSSVGDFSGSQHAQVDIADTASSAVVPQVPGVLPGMSGYGGTLTWAPAPNTAFDARRARSTSRLSAGLCHSWSVSPMGLTITQRQAQLVANIVSTAASDVGRVAVTVDVARNVAQQALETASHTAESTGQSKLHACELFDTLQEELHIKFDENHTATRHDTDRYWQIWNRIYREKLQKVLLMQMWDWISYQKGWMNKRNQMKLQHQYWTVWCRKLIN